MLGKRCSFFIVEEASNMNIEKCMKTKCQQCKKYTLCFKSDSKRRCKKSKSMQKNSTNQKNGRNVD